LNDGVFTITIIVIIIIIIFVIIISLPLLLALVIVSVIIAVCIAKLLLRKPFLVFVLNRGSDGYLQRGKHYNLFASLSRLPSVPVIFVKLLRINEKAHGGYYAARGLRGRAWE